MLAYRLVILVGQMLAEIFPATLAIPSIPSSLGPLSLLHWELVCRGFSIRQGNVVETAEGRLLSLQQPTGEREMQRWRHKWREELRRPDFADLARRRSMFRDIVEGVDRAWSRAFFEILENPQWRFHVAMTLTGAQVTAHSRHLIDSTVSPLCPYCHLEEESQEHRMSECCHFQDVRDRWGVGEYLGNLPKVTRACGIQLKNSELLPMDLLRVHACHLEISLRAMHQDKGLPEARQEEIPSPALLVTWMQHGKIKKLVHEKEKHQDQDSDDEEAPVDMRPSTPMIDGDDDLLDVMEIAGHRVLWEGPDQTRCTRCPARYVLSNMHRYAWTACSPGAGNRPISKIPVPPKNDISRLLIPTHAGRAHVFAETKYRQDILCTRCGARWPWGARFALSRSTCLGSEEAERARRLEKDLELPIARNGHIPALHPLLNVLFCRACNYITRSESIRTFDRFICTAATGLLMRPGRDQIRNRHKQTRYLPIRTMRGHAARCRGCAYTVPWHARRTGFKRHACA